MSLKKIEAYVRRDRLSFILMELDGLPGFPGVTVLDCQGMGRRTAEKPRMRIAEFLLEQNRHSKLEIICQEEAMPAILEGIRNKAGGANGAEPKIYTSDISESKQGGTLPAAR
jgi:nitrogen regulatory protein PII